MTTQTVLERVYPGRRAALKREILATSLRVFNEVGIDAASIDVIKTASAASVGAIYHHFSNKDGLIAALFFCAQDDLAELLQRYLARASTAEEGVHAIVYSYIDWITAEPELARFQFQARSFVAKGPHADRLVARNKARNSLILRWFSASEMTGALPLCPLDLLPSLVIGQSESYCRAWLSGRVSEKPAAHRLALAHAAWSSVQSVARLSLQGTQRDQTSS